MKDSDGAKAGRTRTAESFNPPLFEYDRAAMYRWQAFDTITVATVTWNRLEYTRKLIDSVLRCSHVPYRLLIVDNGSQDGTVDFLRALAEHEPHVTVIENRQNRGLIRGLQQIRDHLDSGLVICCDNDMEVLTNYWLVLVLKAFHAHRLAKGSLEVAFGLRATNLDEYGFRYATSHEILRIPGSENSEPRTSYAVASKEEADPVVRLDEEVVVGWTGHLTGNVQAIPVDVFRRIRYDETYPLYIGGTDSFTSSELTRLGVPMAYIDNGPVVRHNDWPYSDEKIRLYQQMAGARAVTDLGYVRWKMRALLKRFRG